MEIYNKIFLLQYNLLKMMLDEDPTKRPTTLDIKAKPPLQNYEIDHFNTNSNSRLKWHSSQRTRHSSTSSSDSSSNNSFEVLI
jgi:eukaryotic translation initiation factor 2-alpha kinase 3